MKSSDKYYFKNKNNFRIVFRHLNLERTNEIKAKITNFVEVI